MRRAVLALGVLCLLIPSAAPAQATKPVETIPVNQIHAGMKGIALTVFQGTKPEPMDVEVLGVLRNANGPKGDVILVRLGGAKAEYTGVVGESGEDQRRFYGLKVIGKVGGGSFNHASRRSLARFVDLRPGLQR